MLTAHFNNFFALILSVTTIGTVDFINRLICPKVLTTILAGLLNSGTIGPTFTRTELLIRF